MNVSREHSALLILVAVIVFLCSCPSPALSIDSSAVARYGQLGVRGNTIVDRNGNPVVLRGMSLNWSQWHGKFYNYDCVKWLRDDWKITVLRAAMAVESGGYLTNPSVEKAKVIAVVDACINLGIYVIIDWHDHHAHLHTSQSVAFFEEMAAKYGTYPHVIYEIYNEPQPPASWDVDIKPYADTVVKHIRAIDPDNLIVVGTPSWSQDVYGAALNPLSYNNITYTLHFYAASHGQWLRDVAAAALSLGAALFVSEFGTCESSGTGVLDSVETEIWMRFMEQNKLSWCNWSIADMTETSAALPLGASGTGGWPVSLLKPSGLMIRGKIREGNDMVATTAESASDVPAQFGLDQNYPNPFNPATTIEYQIPKQSLVKLKIFDLLGREIATLVNEQKGAGAYSVQWDAKRFSSGIYFYTLSTGEFRVTKKLILMR
jgi:endoglucanase